MKAVFIYKPLDMGIKEISVPAPREGEALLKVLYGGICGSDLGTYKGSALYSEYPRIPGHEFSARIIKIGVNEKGLTEGMIVTCNPYFNCGVCYSCTRGYVNCCTGNQTMGAQRDGAFQEFLTMPIERIFDVRGLPPRLAALVEPFCIGHHAMKRVQVKPGERVLVVGAGTIGLFAATAAKLAGASVYICDVAQTKLNLVGVFGFDGTILNSDDESFADRVSEITGGNGFDVCVEAVGIPSTFMNCINAAAYRGRVVVVGIGKQSLNFHYSILQKKELDVFGSRNALNTDFLEAIETFKEGKINLESIISCVYPLDEVSCAFEDFKNHGAEKLKVLIKFPE
jgi:2-desacetyl-2-hydroxyethyl bacteriochlorophyllide A dehydrogenase